MFGETPVAGDRSPTNSLSHFAVEFQGAQHGGATVPGTPNVVERYFGPTTSTNPNMWSLIEWTRFMQITRNRPVFSKRY